jgi:triacylglycerol lipase
MSDDSNSLNPGVVFEVTSVAIQGLLYPFGIKPRQLKALGPGRTRPIILVPGYGANRSCMFPLEAYLRAIGFDRIFPFDFSVGSGIEPAAKHLKEFVEQVRQACGTGRKTVDLVAHSLGGLAARVYLQDLKGARHVDQCITISTPHNGTYSSYWAPTIVGRQMRPESEFLKDLNLPAKRAPGVRFLSIWAELDLMVLPRENSIYAEGNDQLIEGAGHMGILMHPKVLKLVAERLRAGQDIPSTKLERLSLLAKGIWRKSRALIGPAKTTEQ